MIYLDSSVALAHLLAEERRPADALWAQPLIASRLLAYEMWGRLHAYAVGPSLVSAARELLAEVDFLEMTPAVMARALEPFPVALRTLDALHLATMEYLRGRGAPVELASYDERLLAGARALGITAYPL